MVKQGKGGILLIYIYLHCAPPLTITPPWSNPPLTIGQTLGQTIYPLTPQYFIYPLPPLTMLLYI